MLKGNGFAGGGEVTASFPSTDCYQKGVITTSRFSLGPSVHAKQAIIRRAARSWMAVALPLAALVIGGLVYDTRLLIVSAAIMFVLFPVLLFFGWYGILTRPWAVASLFPQEVSLASDNEITVEYHPMDGRDVRPPADLVIPSDMVTGCSFFGRTVIVSYGGSRELIIPMSAFPDASAALAFQSRLEGDSASGRRHEDDF